ncbi:hypothetical protein BDZ94DRAFT_1298690 [Collybia nuda]|uniref:F-box domain-containing protein n=1 Tax=Collybia nuda TaxID=64659 RepID=A0A9P5Y5V5_9AGAR|nr:hypothetical protein BDZ94DRAFT_1298690 [Collybia nuda]
MTCPQVSSAILMDNGTLHDMTQDFPPEVMAKILTLICGMEVLIPTPNSYPWIIGYVCSRWRQILWHTPEIWNKITIGYRSSSILTTPPKEYTVGDILKHILSNTTGPMSLVVTEAGHMNYGNMWDIILDNFGRFVDLSMDPVPQHTLTSIFNLPPSAFSRLESLLLFTTDFNGSFPELSTSPLQSAPNLRCVNYEIPSLNYVPSLLLLPWATIKVIDVKRMHIPPDVIFHIFRSSPSLESCRFLIDSTQEIPDTHGIILPFVEELVLFTQKSFDWNGFFRQITTPSLQCLILQSPHVPCLPVTSLILRSRCPMAKLDIFGQGSAGHHNGGDGDVESLLDNLPSLKRLIVPWSIPPSIFGKIYKGDFPKLALASFFVRPDRFGAFLDMMDLYIASPPKHR